MSSTLNTLVTELEPIYNNYNSEPMTVERLNEAIALIQLDSKINLDNKTILHKDSKYTIYLTQIDYSINLNVTGNKNYLKLAYKTHYNAVKSLDINVKLLDGYTFYISPNNK